MSRVCSTAEIVELTMPGLPIHFITDNRSSFGSWQPIAVFQVIGTDFWRFTSLCVSNRWIWFLITSCRQQAQLSISKNHLGFFLTTHFKTMLSLVCLFILCDVMVNLLCFYTKGQTWFSNQQSRSKTENAECPPLPLELIIISNNS